MHKYHIGSTCYSREKKIRETSITFIIKGYGEYEIFVPEFSSESFIQKEIQKRIDRFNK